ncbi:CYTH domain-containing protein [Shewanella sp. Isolate11]|uniref:CYTH domain-containing protein n=1 Tax=Shewanella sp. Isolate11 TaxID=2908530 RepID=UPI001EFE13A4|nr:CYTH domain-containing protein [Shewanella sp. Isolate11]MCG9697552.1 CYTH domain-containing protein [Shewanella sp. Isolate11]
MEAEIELKLFFPENEREALVSLLNSLPHSEPKGSKHLSNSYFDTPELTLRHWDMGLRVRGCNGQFEQTIKTAGTVVGGVHSRPEYNVDICEPEVDLSLFPQQIWPDNGDIQQVQQQLYSLFDTDFTRMIWHIYIDESLVEVALDIGFIGAGELSEPICELEFELLAGDTLALLSLGEQVTQKIPARLGRASKAQRGYRLAAMSSPLQLEILDFIALDKMSDLKQAFITLLSTGLERWQLLESMLLESSDDLTQLPLLSYRLRACIRLIRCSLKQFELLDQKLEQEIDAIEQHLDYVEQGLNLTQVLEDDAAMLASVAESEAIIVEVEQGLTQLAMPTAIQSMLADTGYGHLQLSLVNLLFACRAGKINVGTEIDLQAFADQMQEESWQRIVKLMPSEAQFNSEDYQSFAKALDESILVGFAYGELYSTKARDQFRAPWQDLILGIRTLGAYRCLRQLSQSAGITIDTWLDDNEHSLLFAMEHSRRRALKSQPYWR